MVEKENKYLLITSVKAVNEMETRLKDLNSRFKNILTAKINKPDDELIYALETFGVKGKVRRINQGPVITLFEIEPDEGVRVNKFTNLSDDLSRVMKASKVRVIAPIPGTRFVGIEVPNDSPAIVYLKNIISSEESTLSDNNKLLKLKGCLLYTSDAADE